MNWAMPELLPERPLARVNPRFHGAGYGIRLSWSVIPAEAGIQ